jgi:hypothetical protein
LKEVLVDIIVIPTVREALINDMLIDELEIAVKSFSKGIWRFKWKLSPLTVLDGICKYLCFR